MKQHDKPKVAEKLSTYILQSDKPVYYITLLAVIFKFFGEFCIISASDYYLDMVC